MLQVNQFATWQRIRQRIRRATVTATPTAYIHFITAGIRVAPSVVKTSPEKRHR